MKTQLSIFTKIFSTFLLIVQVAEATPCSLIRRESPLFTLISVVGNTISGKDKEEKKVQKKTEEVTFAVNMHCDNCKARIERALTWHKGVKDLEVKLKALTVRVRFDSRKTSVQDIQQAITTLGYTCEPLP